MVDVTDDAATLSTVAIHTTDLSILAASVTVDLSGTTVTPVSVTPTSDGVTVDLGALAAAANQQLTVRFDATISSTAATDPTTSATVGFTGAGGAATASGDGSVPLNRPDFSVGPDNPQTVAVPRGVNAATDFEPTYVPFAVEGSPLSTGPAVLTLTFPAGVSLAYVEFNHSDRAACTSTGGTATCQLTQQLIDEVFGDIYVNTTTAPAIGAHLAITASVVSADGYLDPTPSDNTRALPIVIVGKADLHYRVAVPSLGIDTDRSAQASIPVGKPVHVVISVTNDGPDPATDVSFSWGPPGPPGPGFTLSYPSGTTRDSSGLGVTTIPTLAPGATATRTVTVTGTKPGASTVIFAFQQQSTSYDPTYQCSSDPACLGAAAVRLTTAAAAASGTSTSTGSTGTASTSAAPVSVANTGGPVAGLLLLAAGLLLTGAGSVVVGRRRPTGF